MAVPTRIELAIFCVTGRRDNRYTTEPWLREKDLNQRPSGYEPDELPDCSIPRYSLKELAEVEGFEPPRGVNLLSVFKTDPFSRTWVNLRFPVPIYNSMTFFFRQHFFNKKRRNLRFSKRT